MSHTRHIGGKLPVSNGQVSAKVAGPPTSQVCDNKCGVLNCILFNARSIVNKLNLLTAIADPKVVQCIFITETWANAGIPDSILCPKGYQIFRQDRASRGGGVCMFLPVASKAFVGPSPPPELGGTEVLVVDFHQGNERTRLILIYHPPVDSTNRDKCNLLINHLVKLVKIDFPVIIVGDLNKPGIDWSNLTASSELEDDFLSFMCSNGFTQLVDFPTKGESYLDLVFGNFPVTVCDINCEPPFSFSDNPPHMGVGFKLVGVSSVDGAAKRRYYPKADYDAAGRLLAGISWESKFETCGSVNEMWVEFKDTLNEVLDICVPSCNSTTRKGGFLCNNRELKNARKKKCSAWQKYKKFKDIVTLNVYKRISTDYRKLVNKTIASNELKIIKTKDRTVLHRYIRRKLNSRRAIPPLRSEVNNDLVTDSKCRADIMNRCFGLVFTKDNGLEPTNLTCYEGDELVDVVVTADKVRNAIKNLNWQGASGPDNLPAVVFVRLAEFLAKPLACIYRLSVATGELPDDWKTAVVSPIFKKGDPSIAGNYRPISLTCVACRLLERIIGDTMREYLNEKCEFKNQFGFMAGRSSVFQLLRCLDLWTKAADSHSPFHVIYLDFARAFDRVSHPKLLI